MSFNARRARAGFTLVEVLVSLALMLLLSSIAILVYRSAADFRESATARIRRSAEVRSILAALAHDLSGTFPGRESDAADGRPVFALTDADDDGEPDELALCTATENHGPVEYTHVRYRVADGRLLREVWEPGEGGGWRETALSGNATRIVFATEGARSPAPGDLPAWVWVKLYMRPLRGDGTGPPLLYSRRLPVPTGGEGRP